MHLIPQLGMERLSGVSTEAVQQLKNDPLCFLFQALCRGGEAGLRCGEIMALDWGDVDLGKRQLCVQRSDWKGHVTATKGGRLRYGP